ncbi:hypothetical protein ACFL7D_07925 [candidate division KSB1 bacterium]
MITFKKVSFFIIVVLITTFTGISFSQDVRSVKIPGLIAPVKLFPYTYRDRIEINSPIKIDNGSEYLVGYTEGAYALIDVTIKNKGPYFESGKFHEANQTIIDTLDFPELVKTGLHSNDRLSSTETITGKPVGEITTIGRPNMFSGAGFMAEDEDIISVLKGDNFLVSKMGMNHPQMAKILFHVWNLVIRDYELGKIGRYYSGSFEYILYNGKKVTVKAHGTKGFQESIFNDEVRGNFEINISREPEPSERDFLKENYSFLNKNQFDAFIKKLTFIHTGEMVPYYVMMYGFYEGHTDYRADPVSIAFIFGLKTIEELHSFFDGDLYNVLNEHFTGY